MWRDVIVIISLFHYLIISPVKLHLLWICAFKCSTLAGFLFGAGSSQKQKLKPTAKDTSCPPKSTTKKKVKVLGHVDMELVALGGDDGEEAIKSQLKQAQQEGVCDSGDGG